MNCITIKLNRKNEKDKFHSYTEEEWELLNSH